MKYLKCEFRTEYVLFHVQADLGHAGEPGPHGSDSKMPPSNILIAAKSAERTAEEKLARDFHVLFRDVSGKCLLAYFHSLYLISNSDENPG